MTSTITRTGLFSLALLALPLALQAQEATSAPPAAEEPDSATVALVQGWVVEMQELNGRLQILQQQALEDPGLDAAQAELGERIRTTMMAADPTLAASVARVEELHGEAAAAEERSDTTRLMEIGEEVRRIDSAFFEAQQRALATPEIAAELEAFQARGDAKIVELDPQAPQMIARFLALREQLAAVLQEGS
jgi:hypothetical protein